MLKTTLELTLITFRRDNFDLKKTPEMYEDFLTEISDLKENEFMLDFHMPNYLLVFNAKTQFYDHPLYLDGSIVLQDKASCLSVEAMNPPPGN